ncbi:hypothetical protein GH865_10980 [Rhodocyclus tenuis]|uniref:hypothetical protein n=1 Tax=Rhodocyclus gracilis TaxID=2929842 RepID=UPI001298B1AE|nr:hypothetical protein [Rhodocyclus gracilis]MRD73768.1 hypothetical protein [Rhodocyclus gracilis]
MIATDYGQLALHLATDCDAAQARRVRWLSVCAISLLSWQFGLLALAAAIGSLIGLGICALARHGASQVRSRAAKIEADARRDRSEAQSCHLGSISAGYRIHQSTTLRARYAREAIHRAIGIVHIALARQLLTSSALLRA